MTESLRLLIERIVEVQLPLFVGLGFAATLLSALLGFLIALIRTQKKEAAPLERQLDTTLRALEKNSQEALRLLGLLQGEVAERTRTVQDIEARLDELRQQRTLLELTDVQKKALESLVRPQPSPRQILTSLDFWLGRVTPGAVFFVLGVIVTLLIRR